MTQTVAVTPTDDATAIAHLGQTITLSGGLGDNEIAVTVTTATKHVAAVDNTWIRPAKGVYLAIAAEIRVVRGKTYACACDFALVAADGSLFEPGWGVGFNQAMQSVTLNTGERTSGLVVFDLPESALGSGAVIQLRPEWTNDVRGKWLL